MAKLIPNRYAEAFFELALELEKLDTLEGDAACLRDALCADRAFTLFLAHPQIGSDEKFTALQAVFGESLAAELLGLVHVLFRKNRESELVPILDAFLEKAKAHKGIVTATVTAAHPLTQDQAARVAQMLAGKLQKKVEVKAVADPSVVGGVSVQVAGRIFDGTLKKKIRDMKTLIRGGTT
jgi:F-type H+-transporting ATPase subunit delta